MNDIISIPKDLDKSFVKAALLNHPANMPEDIKATLELYSYTRTVKPRIFMAYGSASRMSGADESYKVLKEYIDDKKIDAELVLTSSKGLLSAEPSLDIQLPGKNRLYFRNVTHDKVANILDGALNNNIPEENLLGQFRQEGLEAWDYLPFVDEHPFFKGQNKSLTHWFGWGNPVSIYEYISRGGYKAFIKTLSNYTASEICDFVEESGLRGRGGAGFLTAKKWKIARNTIADKKYLICNADESDPGAFMDRRIVEGAPHRVIEGIAIAAYAIGASQAYVFINGANKHTVNTLQDALDRAYSAGILGENIFDSGYKLHIQIKTGAGAFVCGEETALINSLEGKRAMPRHKPPYPAEKGLHGMPTIVNNVETLANIPEIIKNGPKWYQGIGTEKSPGTKILSVTGKTKYSGVIEVEMGTTLEEIIYGIAGGLNEGSSLKAIQIGGPTGRCLAADKIDTGIDYESMAEAKSFMGSGGIVVMDDSSCMVDIARYFIDFIHKESCGKCIPCREGTRRMMEILDSIVKKPKTGMEHDPLDRFKGVMMLENLAEVIKDTSLCGLGKSAAEPVLSTLAQFREEYEEHIFERKCRAGVCVDLMTYTIDPDSCTGCMACIRKCPTAAIIGSERKPHYIIQDKCISCGKCLETCKFNAVLTS